MSETVEIQPHDHVVLCVVQKRALDESSARELLDEVLTAAAARPAVPVAVDLGRVKFAPSVALGALVKLSRTLQIEGRRVALVGVDNRVMDAVRVTNLHTLLEIHDTLDDVLGDSPRSP